MLACRRRQTPSNQEPRVLAKTTSPEMLCITALASHFDSNGGWLLDSTICISSGRGLLRARDARSDSPLTRTSLQCIIRGQLTFPISLNIGLLYKDYLDVSPRSPTILARFKTPSLRSLVHPLEVLTLDGRYCLYYTASYRISMCWQQFSKH